MPKREHRTTAHGAGRSDARASVQRAVSTLYQRARPGPALRWREGEAGSPWRLVAEFTIGGERFVVACQASGSRAAALTPREREVVALAATGESNKAIGYRLGISASTVGVLLWRAAGKLGVSRRELRAP